jgi:dynein intermediate chain
VYERSTQTEETWEPSTNDAWVGNDDSIGRETRQQNLEQLKEEWLKEKEEELQSKYQQPTVHDEETGQKAPSVSIRTLEGEELNAVVESHDYKEFLDKSVKIADRALEEPYDILVDYSLDTGALEDDEDFGKGRTRKGRRVKQVLQFWDDKWSRKRIISDVGFSPKVMTISILAPNL